MHPTLETMGTNDLIGIGSSVEFTIALFFTEMNTPWELPKGTSSVVRRSASLYRSARGTGLIGRLSGECSSCHFQLGFLVGFCLFPSLVCSILEIP